ncbi:MAG: hypothetical protein RSC93_14025 [Erysipelotrichaceae bacterium]
MKMNLPKNYCEIKEDEIHYIDGGFRTDRVVHVQPQWTRVHVLSYIGAATCARFLQKAGIAIITGSPIGAVYSTFTSIVSFSVGFAKDSKAAYAADKADGKIDNYITRWIPARDITEINPYPPHSSQGAYF